MKTIALFLTCMLGGIASYAQWVQLGPQGGNIKDLEEINGVYWAGTSSGIFTSANEGLSWQKLPLLQTSCSDILEFNDTMVVFYYDTAHDFFGELVTGLYSITSFNGGAAWSTPALLPLSSYLVLSDYKIRKHGSFLYTSEYFWPNELYLSSDYGLSWQQVSVLPFIPDTEYPYVDTFALSGGDSLTYHYKYGIVRIVPAQDTFYVTNTGIFSERIYTLQANRGVLFASTDYYFYRSTDGGLNWDTVPFFDYRFVRDMAFMGDTVLAIAGEYQNILGRSFDNGVTWDTMHVNLSGSSQEFVLLEALNGKFYHGEGDTISYSDDVGVTWHNLPPLPVAQPNPSGWCGLGGHDISGPITVHKNTLFAVTNDGLIYKFNESTQTWSKRHCFWSPGAHNGNILYDLGAAIVMSGRDEMSYSLDNGITWVDPPLNGLPVIDTTMGDRVIPRSLVNLGGLWVGSCGRLGLYASQDNGHSWFLFDATPFSSSGGLRVMNNVLYSGSSGSSVWRRTGTFSMIDGVVYRDLNNNGVKEPGENTIPGVIVRANPANWYATSDDLGHYSLLTDAVGDTMRPVLPVSFATSNPSHYITAGVATNKNFGIYLQPNIPDLSIDVTNVNAFVVGFKTTLNLVVKNKGSVDQAPQVQLVLDTSLSVISSDPPHQSISGDTVTWTLGNLSFLETAGISVVVESNAGIVMFGDSVQCTAIVNPVAVDSVPSDNYAYIRTLFLGAYDPNDKQCEQGSYVTVDRLEANEDLVFTVRFQNTGNFPATFVRIEDTLSSYFDLSTFKVVSSSHPMHWNMSGNGIVNFHFDQINLPPSSDDELGSNGYVKYSVRCKESVVAGNALENTAYIYFDFNPAIVTNTTTTLVGYEAFPPIVTSPVPVEVITPPALTFSVYPNPADDYVNISFDARDWHGEVELYIYDGIGGLVASKLLTDTRSTLNVSQFAKGLYFATVRQQETGAKGVFKFVVE